jgi:hypothetical protein
VRREPVADDPRIVLPAAMPGVLTGAILAMARGAGEVAPLMLVGAVNWRRRCRSSGDAPFLHGDRTFMHLGFHIYNLGFPEPGRGGGAAPGLDDDAAAVAIVLGLNLFAIADPGAATADGGAGWTLLRTFGDDHDDRNRSSGGASTEASGAAIERGVRERSTAETYGDPAGRAGRADPRRGASWTCSRSTRFSLWYGAAQALLRHLDAVPKGQGDGAASGPRAAARARCCDR